MWPRTQQRSHGVRAHRLAVATTQRFRAAVQQEGSVFDDEQRGVIERLLDPQAHGFYLWGPAGRGKSMLADLYFEAAPTVHKRRFHFHDFFRALHAEITATRQPIEASIRAIIGSASLVLFDEFHVHDVADAHYLARTLDILLEQGVFVLATSNYAPEDLLPNPLFHDRFVPAITLIRARLDVVAVGAGVDYRRIVTNRDRTGFAAGSWVIVPHDSLAESSGVALHLDGFRVWASSVDDRGATFIFTELCARPLGIREYLRLAEDFETIRIVAVPDLAAAEREPLLRLCNLIDVLSDRDRRLDIEAVAPPERMLEAPHPPRDAVRSLSRLAMLQRRRPQPWPFASSLFE